MNFKNFKYDDELATDVEAGLYALCKQIDLKSLYTETWCFELSSDINSVMLSDGIIEFMTTAVGLRMNFFSDKGVIKKRYNNSDVVINKVTSQEKTLSNLIKECTEREYDLENELLIEFCIYENFEETDSLYLLINSHHIVTDAWTKNLMLSQIMRICKGDNIQNEINENSVIFEQNPSEQVKQEFKKYKNTICSYPSKINKFSNSNSTYSGSTISFSLEKNVVIKLIDNSNASRVSLFAYLLSLFYAYVCYFSKEDNFKIGVPFARRLNKNEEESLGYFVKILPFSLEIPIDNLLSSDTEYFRETQKMLFKLSSFISVHHESNDKSINTIFSFQETEIIEGINRELFISQNGAKFDLTVNFKKSGHTMICEFEFSDEAWTEGASIEFSEGFNNFVNIVVNGSKVSLIDNLNILELDRSVSIISGKQKSIGFNIYEHFMTVNSNFSKIAVIEKDKTVTYEELDRKINQLSVVLSRHYPNLKIACLQLTRSVDAIALILALAKNNITHVSLSKLYPEDRVKFILEDSGANLYISDQEIPKFVNINSISITELLDLSARVEPITELTNSPLKANSNNDIFELIYTSGTTGNPKGVEITQKNILNFVSNFSDLNLNKDDIFTHSSSYTFDACFFEVWMPLLNNASVYIIEDPITDFTNWDFSNTFYKPSVSFFTTSLFNLLVENDFIGELHSIEKIYIGGEAATKKFINKAISKYGKKVINLYGPTENTCVTSAMIFDKIVDMEIPLGKILANTSVGIINSNDRFLPRDTFGEIVISGSSLMNGYYHNDDMTEKSIIYLPTDENTIEKFYKTGDIGRIGHDSLLYYKSRKDSQVKIRGFRVELSEIETKALNIEGVSKCIVKFNKNSLNRTLTLIYEGSISSNHLRECLIKVLPAYMIPNEIKQVSELKLNINGKLEQKLEYIEEVKEFNKLAKKEDNEVLEKIILESIKETLQTDNVDNNTDFYVLGIDSIVSIQICSHLNSRGINIKVSDVFNYPTVTLLVERINQIQSESNNYKELSLWRENRLSPIQKWFFEIQKNNEYLNNFNQTFLVKIDQRITRDKVLEALRDTIDTYNIFNTCFHLKNNEWIQVMNHKMESEYFIKTYKVEDYDEIENILTVLQRSLDIQRKLYNFCLISCGNESYLFFVIHHLIVDGVSWRVFLETFSRNLTTDNSEKSSINAPYFSEWVEFLKKYEVPKNISEYWNSIKLKPFENKYKFSSVKHETLKFSQVETERFKNIVNHSYFADTESCLLALVSTAFSKFSNSNKHLIKVEGHGRPTHAEQFNESIGWFTSMFPFKSILGKTIKNSIIENYNRLKSVPNKGFDFQFENNLDFTSDFSFNFMGEFRSNSFKNFKICSMFRKDDFDSNLFCVDKITFVPLIIDGELELRVSYIEELISNNQIKQILESFVGIVRNFIEEEHAQYLPTTSLQNSLLLKQSSKLNNGAYIIQWNGYFKEIDITKFQFSISRLIKTTEALRCIFEFNGVDAVQIIKKPEEVFESHYIRLLDWSFYSKSEAELSFEKLLIRNRSKGFNLSEGPLFRFTLIKLNSGYYVLFEHHHIILDGWSIPLLFKKLSHFYESDTIEGLDGLQVATLSSAYRYIEKKKKTLDYLKYENIFENYTPVTFYNNDTINSEQSRYLRGIEIDDTLKNFLKEQRITLNEFFLAIWILTLSFVFGRKDILIGATLSGRSTFPVNILNTIGMFVTTLPCRVKNIDSYSNISEMLQDIQRQSSQLQVNDLLSWSDLAIRNDFNEEIQFGYVFENYPIDDNNELISFDKFSGQERVDFPLALSITEKSQFINYELHFKNEIFSKQIINTVANVLDSTVKLIIKNSLSSINELRSNIMENTDMYPEVKEFSILPEVDLSEVLIDSFKKYANSTFVKTFENQASYMEIFEKIQKIITRTGMKKTDTIGVLTENRYSKTMFAIACFISGATYVPLDSSMAKDRLKYIIKDSGINSIFTEVGNFQRLSNDDGTLHNNDIAYIIYTSGSTGKPKGVKVSNRNILNTVKNLEAENILDEKDIVYQNISMIFDPSVTDILYPIIIGAKIYIPHERLYGADLEEVLEEEKVTALSMTPSLLRVSNFTKNTFLKKIIVGGEKLSQSDLQRIPDKINIYNEYGPTEVSVVASVFMINKDNIGRYDYYPIGRGFKNMNYYIVSKDGYRLPFSMPGELVIQGEQVSEGYTQKELNEKVFDFTGAQSKYYTGDICQINKNGEIYFIGRSDRQVKIRGFRIELEEIERVAKSINGIQSCHVIVNTNNSKLYLAYIGAIEERKLKELLSAELPDYMIPQHICKYTKFPLSLSGKTDLKTLGLSLEKNTKSSTSDYKKFESNTYTVIKELLGEVLISDYTLDLQCNFFELGGTSLLAIQFVRKINEFLNLNIKINTLFESKSIESFIEKVEETINGESI